MFFSSPNAAPVLTQLRYLISPEVHSSLSPYPRIPHPPIPQADAEFLCIQLDRGL